MELVAPIATAAAALRVRRLDELTPASQLLLALFLVHYANRAVVQPLRNPPRSPLNASVLISAVLFNAANGYLQGTWLAAHGGRPAAASWPALLGLVLFFLGFAGNVWHDNVLIQLRRQKRPAPSQVRGLTSPYSIPHGGLFALVSYPNYLCECA